MFALLLHLPITEEDKNDTRIKFEDCFHEKPERRPKILHIFEITTAEVYKKKRFRVHVLEYLQTDKLPLVASLHRAGMQLFAPLSRENGTRRRLIWLKDMFLASCQRLTGQELDKLREIRRWLLALLFLSISRRYRPPQSGDSWRLSRGDLIKHDQSKGLYRVQHLTFDHAPQDNSKDGLLEQMNAQLQLEPQQGPEELLRASQVVLKAQNLSRNQLSPESQAVAEIPAVPELQFVPTTEPDKHFREREASLKAHGGDPAISQDAQVDPKTQLGTDIQAKAALDPPGNKVRPSPDVQPSPDGQPSQEVQVSPRTQLGIAILASVSADTEEGKVRPSSEARLRMKARPTRSIRPPPEILTESACLKKLTSYRAFLIRKCAPFHPEEPWGTWARAEVTEKLLQQEQIIEEIKKLSETDRSVVDKKNALTPNQQGQVSAIVEDLVSRESDSDFEWTLVQLDSVTQPVQIWNEVTGRQMFETITLAVFVRRAPREYLDPVALYTNIEYMNNFKMLKADSGSSPSKRTSRSVVQAERSSQLSLLQFLIFYHGLARQSCQYPPHMKTLASSDVRSALTSQVTANVESILELTQQSSLERMSDGSDGSDDRALLAAQVAASAESTEEVTQQSADDRSLLTSQVMVRLKIIPELIRQSSSLKRNSLRSSTDPTAPYLDLIVCPNRILVQHGSLKCISH